MKRVVITGQGAMCALGRSAAETTDAMKSGQCAISELEIDNVERLSVRIGAQIKGYDPAEYFSRSEIALLDPFTQFTLIATKEAVAQSGLTFDGDLSMNTGVVIGTAGGGLQTQDVNYQAVYEEQKNRVHPFVVPRLMASSAASQISIKYGIHGPAFVVSSACASGNHAMGQAFYMVQSGMCRAVVTGGADSMLCFGGIKAWEGLRVLSKDGCRPFCKTRNGMVQGEGAGVFVFEEMEHAKARGAQILGEVVGSAMTSDANDIVMPNTDGAIRAISGALENAGINPEDVDYINAHGTATAVNDRSETQAIRQVFGNHADTVKVSSTKSMHGHVFGGSGAIELLACLTAITDDVIPPTVGFSEPDEDCNLGGLVVNAAIEAKTSVAVSNAFAFGGSNAVLVVKRFQ